MDGKEPRLGRATRVRLKPDTTYLGTQVRLKPDAAYSTPNAGHYVLDT